MNADEFAAKVKPAKKRSCMEPFLADLQQLRAAHYTLAQLQDFLRMNNVEVSIGRISFFLNHRADKGEEKESLTRKPSRNVPIESPAAQREAIAEAALPPAHNPDTLDQIVRATPDLDALAKLGKPRPQRRKK